MPGPLPVPARGALASPVGWCCCDEAAGASLSADRASAACEGKGQAASDAVARGEGLGEGERLILRGSGAKSLGEGYAGSACMPCSSTGDEELGVAWMGTTKAGGSSASSSFGERMVTFDGVGGAMLALEADLLSSDRAWERAASMSSLARRLSKSRGSRSSGGVVGGRNGWSMAEMASESVIFCWSSPADVSCDVDARGVAAASLLVEACAGPLEDGSRCPS